MCYISEMITFGQQLKKLRKEQGLRQKDLAQIFQVAQSTIANYEQGTRFPDEEMLRRLADTFGVSIDYLLGRAVDNRSAEAPQGFGAIETAPVDPEVKRFIHLVLDSSLGEAESMIAGKFRKQPDITRVYMELLQPALYEIGRRWETGEIDVGEEHYFSRIVQDLMARVTRNLNGRKEGPVFVGFSISGELHDIGVRMVSDVLSVKGWKTVYLGSNLPTPSVIKAIIDHGADLVGISVTMSYHINAAAALIRTIRNAEIPKPIKIIVGGQALIVEPELWKKIGADYFLENVEQVESEFGDVKTWGG